MQNFKPLMITVVAASLVVTGAVVNVPSAQAYEVPLLAADAQSSKRDWAARSDEKKKKREEAQRKRTQNAEEKVERKRLRTSEKVVKSEEQVEAGERRRAERQKRTDKNRQRSSSYTDAEGRTRTRNSEVNRDAEAGEASREVSVVGRDGQERNRANSVKKTDEGLTQATSWTDAQGRTVTRDVLVTKDAETGEVTRDVKITGKDGQEYSGTESINRTDTGVVRSGTWVDAQGREATRDIAVNKDAETGALSRDVSAVGRDGKQRTGSQVTTRSENGVNRSSTWTDAQGQTVTRDANATIDRESGSISRNVISTDREGNVRAIDDNAVRTEDGTSRSTTYTNADGEQVTRNTRGRWDSESGTWVREADTGQDDVDQDDNTED